MSILKKVSCNFVHPQDTTHTLPFINQKSPIVKIYMATGNYFFGNLKKRIIAKYDDSELVLFIFTILNYFFFIYY